jgi:hypothetical protein
MLRTMKCKPLCDLPLGYWVSDKSYNACAVAEEVDGARQWRCMSSESGSYLLQMPERSGTKLSPEMV